MTLSETVGQYGGDDPDGLNVRRATELSTIDDAERAFVTWNMEFHRDEFSAPFGTCRPDEGNEYELN
jgi:hypothetical protein